jgi:hypothetical protein
MWKILMPADSGKSWHSSLLAWAVVGGDLFGRLRGGVGGCRHGRW